MNIEVEMVDFCGLNLGLIHLSWIIKVYKKSFKLNLMYFYEFSKFMIEFLKIKQLNKKFKYFFKFLIIKNTRSTIKILSAHAM